MERYFQWNKEKRKNEENNGRMNGIKIDSTRMN